MKAKKTKKSTTKKPPAKKTRRRQPARLAPVWIRAVSDIVASCVARQRVQGADVREATQAIARSLVAAVPRAERVLEMRGHPPAKSDCLCHAYALLEVEAYDSAQESHLPPDAIFSYSMRAFNAYIRQRN